MVAFMVDFLLERFSRWALMHHDVIIRLMFSPSAHAIHLMLLFVAEEDRQQGKSSAVLCRLQKLAKLLRLDVFLHPTPVDGTVTQAELVKFYEKRGFVACNDGYYRWRAGQ